MESVHLHRSAVLRVVLLSILVACVTNAVQPLGKYNVDKTTITVSGISSGGSMATQMHLAYSNVFSAAGLVAGSPYWCAKGTLTNALGPCMDKPEQIDVAELIDQAERYDSLGDIDPLDNIRDDKVFILGGTLDSAVFQGVGMKAQQFYLNYIPEDNIKTVFDLPAEHTFPTMDYGNACSVQASPFIGRCNYDTAYEMLNFFYGGNLLRPSGTVPLLGEFYEFDQVEFFYISPPGMSSMDTVGYVYIPSACVSGITQCKLHVAFHGCLQQRDKIGDEFALNAGYNAVGELNNIIILYPQTTATASNMNACWDWWGYTVYFYATKEANQPLACWRMVEKIAY